MNATTVGALLATPAIVGAALIGPAHDLAPLAAGDHQLRDYALTADALVMIPAMNQDWLDLTDKLYLQPNGFPSSGTVNWLPVPETEDLNASLSGAEQDVIRAVETDWNSGDFSAKDPLYIFGYSQAAVAAGMAEETLHNYGIPSDALHFVMVGDSAAQGGFLSEVMPTVLSWFPESWRADVTTFADDIFKMLNINDAFGLTTPDNYFQTDIYTLSGDGFANWDGGANVLGMFSDHLTYLGLTPQEISGATLETGAGFSNDLTNYYMIDSDDVNMFQSLANSFDMILGGVLAWF